MMGWDIERRVVLNSFTNNFKQLVSILTEPKYLAKMN